MAILTLRNGAQCLVDDDIYEQYRFLPWNQNKLGYVYCTVYDQQQKKPVIVILHRIVVGDVPRGMQTDHINRDKLDNRRCNLRVVTAQENQRNRGVSTHINKTSKYKGVRKSPNGKGWRVVLGRRLMQVCETEREAALLYDAVAYEFWGEHAGRNFPLTDNPYLDAPTMYPVRLSTVGCKRCKHCKNLLHELYHLER